MTKRDKHIRNVAEAIVRQIELLEAPWQRPWETGLPRNFVSDIPYRGCNAVWLMSRSADNDYHDPRWGTYLQINQAGGRVMQGERSTPILFIKSHFIADPMAGLLDDDSEIWRVVPKNRRKIQFWAEHRVFNVEQTVGLELPLIIRKDWMAHKQAESVIRSSGVTIVHSTRHTEATYFPGRDEIHLPPREVFPTADSYYRTVLHELAHATGHPSRMKRECMKDGTKQALSIDEVAREELRAEICSMIVNSTLEIRHDPMHGAAYIKEWIFALSDDPTEIFRATSDAQKMSDYLLRKWGTTERRKPSTSQQSDTSAGNP